MKRTLLLLATVLLALDLVAQTVDSTERMRKFEQVLVGRAGFSYFGYNTKAINNSFAVPEITLEYRVNYPLRESWKISSGMFASMKIKKSPGYDYESIYVSLYDYTYSQIEFDKALSTVNHYSFGVPLLIHYQERKFAAGLGGYYRYFMGAYNADNVDFLHGRNEGGLLGELSFNITKVLSTGFQYSYGLIDIHPRRSGFAIGTPYPDFKTFNRTTQFSVSFSL